MKKPGTLLIIAMVVLSSCISSEQKAIRESVNEKLSTYPESTLKDLYKSYFQDYFGPGHLLSNPEGARNYLEYELEMDDYKDTVLLDPTGYHSNFYRVNLVLVKNGTIPVDSFFHWFLKSTNSVESMDQEVWKEEWGIILSEIEELAPDLPGFQRDRHFIDSLLGAGGYVVHHSQQYMDAYHPHYRIIKKEVWDAHLKEWLSD